MAPHSSTFAWQIPWMEEPGRLQSMGSLRVGQDWVTSLSLFTFMHWRRKWQPTPVFLPGESQWQGNLVGCHLWGHTESDMTEVTYQQQQPLSSVKLLSHIQLFVTPWAAAFQVSLSITHSQILLKLMSIKSVMPSNHLMVCCPLLFLPSIFPSIRSFTMSQFFVSGDQSIEASASVLPRNIQN